MIVDIEDRHINLVVGLLSNLKQNIVKNITIQKEQTKGISNLDRFRQLQSNSNNTAKLTMDMATNTSEMVNDGLF